MLIVVRLLVVTKQLSITEIGSSNVEFEPHYHSFKIIEKYETKFRESATVWEFAFYLPGQIVIGFQRIVVSGCGPNTIQWCIVLMCSRRLWCITIFIVMRWFVVGPMWAKWPIYEHWIYILGIAANLFVRRLWMIGVTPTHLTWCEITLDIKLWGFKINRIKIQHSQDVYFHNAPCFYLNWTIKSFACMSRHTQRITVTEANLRT